MFLSSWCHNGWWKCWPYTRAQCGLSTSAGNPSPDSHTLIATYAIVASFCLGRIKKKLRWTQIRRWTLCLTPLLSTSPSIILSQNITHSAAHTNPCALDLSGWWSGSRGPQQTGHKQEKSIKLHFALLIANLTSKVLFSGHSKEDAADRELLLNVSSLHSTSTHNNDSQTMLMYAILTAPISY